MKEAAKLRVGFLLQEEELDSVASLVMQQSKHAMYYENLCFVTIQHTFQPNVGLKKINQIFRQFSLIQWIERFVFNVICTVETIFFSKSIQKNLNHAEKSLVPIQHLETNVHQTDPNAACVFNERDIERLKNHQLDAMIVTTGNSDYLSEEFISIFSMGVFGIEYPFSAEAGGVAGFFEVLTQRAASLFSINKISVLSQSNPTVFQKETLYQGAVYSVPLFLQNKNKLIKSAHFHLHVLLEQLGKTRQIPTVLQQQNFSAMPAGLPKLTQQLRYCWQTFCLLSKKKLWKIQKRSMRWGIAYQFTPHWQQVNLSRSLRIKNPANHFLADPFVIYKHGQHICFVEDLDYATAKGKITAYHIQENGYASLGTVLEESFHLSFPFVFEDGDDLYMCPETFQTHEIRLYKCTEFPLKWTFHQTLIKGISAADTNIFKCGNKWWMLTNINCLGLDDHNAELYLFYADTLNTTDWKPHPLNPIVHDPLQARNGGLIIENDELFRVFQIQGFDDYGQAMGVAQIKTLTETEYEETVLFNIKPSFFEDLKGTHTLGFQHGLLVVDYKKLEKMHGEFFSDL